MLSPLLGLFCLFRKSSELWGVTRRRRGREPVGFDVEPSRICPSAELSPKRMQRLAAGGRVVGVFWCKVTCSRYGDTLGGTWRIIGSYAAALCIYEVGSPMCLHVHAKCLPPRLEWRHGGVEHSGEVVPRRPTYVEDEGCEVLGNSELHVPKDLTESSRLKEGLTITSPLLLQQWSSSCHVPNEKEVGEASGTWRWFWRISHSTFSASQASIHESSKLFRDCLGGRSGTLHCSRALVVAVTDEGVRSTLCGVSEFALYASQQNKLQASEVGDPGKSGEQPTLAWEQTPDLQYLLTSSRPQARKRYIPALFS
ncbi:hypothetical protein BKA70DRAFT_1239674 [Coprinopsis sp. MPI-PUGE-AT-0042]|nr:hypothetical protein BKA70DRAFT_1239674 [Coprinopsis sp. MPI-PUGE-AT-0042]